MKTTDYNVLFFKDYDGFIGDFYEEYKHLFLKYKWDFGFESYNDGDDPDERIGFTNAWDYMDHKVSDFTNEGFSFCVLVSDEFILRSLYDLLCTFQNPTSVSMHNGFNIIAFNRYKDDIFNNVCLNDNDVEDLDARQFSFYLIMMSEILKDSYDIDLRVSDNIMEIMELS